jgi:hypothetical protein
VYAFGGSQVNVLETFSDFSLIGLAERKFSLKSASEFLNGGKFGGEI